MSLRPSFHVAALATTLGALALVAGCSAAPTGAEEGTDGVNGKASQDEANGTIIVSNPPVYTVAPGALWTETTGGSATECTETNVAIPSALSGCTYGAMYTQNAYDRLYAWACPASVQIPAGGFGLAPSHWYESVTITSDPSVGFACFGEPDAPWVLVVDDVAFDPSHIKNVCEGICD